MKLSTVVSKCLFAAGSLFLAGCETENVCNMTPEIMPQNQSKKYTLTMAVRGSDSAIVQKSIRPYVTVNGEKYEMQKHPTGNNIFVYDYAFDGIGIIPYYFELTYEKDRRGRAKERTTKSKLFNTKVTDKYIFALDSSRGPIGATVSVVGSGLFRTDRVQFGGRVVPSNWLSSGAVEFNVPSVECDKEYEVRLLSNGKSLLAGTFFVDVATLRCSADSIHLASGESVRLVFMLDNPAPEGGVAVNVTTDIPESIIMPEIFFAEGERTVSVEVTGGEEPARGTLFVSAVGFTSFEIPVTVGDLKEVTVKPTDGIQANNTPPPVKAENSADADIVVL